MAETLTIDILKREAAIFAREESLHAEPTLFGVTDGKTIGTYLEQKFRAYVIPRFRAVAGNSAKGIDFPELNVDIKVTSEKQPQSSCPFESARQKIFGLGYSLLVFVYDKKDDPIRRTATLNILSTLFIEAAATADYKTTKSLREMLNEGANAEEIVAFLMAEDLPMDEVEANKIAQDLLRSPPAQGYLTVSNAQQWRLTYGRSLKAAGTAPGVLRLGA